MASGYSTAVLATPGLIDYLVCDEAAGSFADSVGSAAGVPHSAAPYRAPSLLFDADDNGSTLLDGTVNCPVVLSSLTAIAGVPWTVEILLSPVFFAAGFGDNTFRTIFGFNASWRLLFTNDGSTILDQYGPGANFGSTYAGLTLNDGLTHHLAFAVASDQTRAIYVDGVHLTPDFFEANSAPSLAYMGSYETPPITNYPFKGRQGHLALYSTRVSAADIANHALIALDGAPPVQTQTLVAGGPIARRFQ